MRVQVGERERERDRCEECLTIKTDMEPKFTWPTEHVVEKE